MKTTDFQLNQRVTGKACETVDVEIIPKQPGLIFKPRRLWAHDTCHGTGALIGPPRIGDREQRWGSVSHDGALKWLPVEHFDYDNQSGTVAIAFDICVCESFIIPVKFEKDCTVDISVFGWGGMRE